MKEPLPTILDNRQLLAGVFIRPWSRNASHTYTCYVAGGTDLSAENEIVLNALFSKLGIGKMKVKELGVDNTVFALDVDEAFYHDKIIPIQAHFASDMAKCGRLTDWAKHIYSYEKQEPKWVDRVADTTTPKMQR